MAAALTPLDQFEFHHVLEARRGVSLVIFTGPACGACRALKRALAEAAERFADLHLYEVDAQAERGLVEEFEVFHLPALFLYRDGRFHSPVHAESTPERLRAAIDTALAAPAQEAP